MVVLTGRAEGAGEWRGCESRRIPFPCGFGWQCGGLAASAASSCEAYERVRSPLYGRTTDSSGRWSWPPCKPYSGRQIVYNSAVFATRDPWQIPPIGSSGPSSGSAHRPSPPAGPHMGRRLWKPGEHRRERRS